MTLPIQGPLHGEIILPGEGITLVLAMHPLKLDRQVETLPAGLTVAELVDLGRAIATTRIRSRVAVYLDGQIVPEAWWACVRPKPGTSMLVRAVAGQGAGDLLRSVLGLAVVAAGIFLAPVIAPILGLSAGLVGAAITVGGQLLINALFPIAAPQLASSSGTTSQTYSISGGQNAADPFGVIPVILGKNRYYPKLGARSYTEFIGADQYLRMLFVWGYGPLDISEIKIGETLLSDFEDVEVETRFGYPDDEPVTLYPNEVIQDDLTIDLTFAAGWQQRTSATAVDEISLDIVAPGGIVRIDSSGNSNNYTVSIRAEYSPAGMNTWTLLDTLDITSQSTDAIRTSMRLVMPSNGQYDVQVKKTSTDYSGGDHVQEDVVWTALRGFRNSPPISFSKPLAVTALRIRASSQLNGVIDDLSGICQSKGKSWNGATWLDDTITRNPGDLFRLVLQSPANAKPVDDDHIDLSMIEAYAERCTSEGFTFDMVRDFSASVYDTLTDVGTGGRGAVLFRDGKWSLAWEEASDPIIQHFTPRNSWGFTGSRTYTQMPHAFRISFVNEDNGYQQDERIVYDDGYNTDGSSGLTAATLFEQIEFPGQTNPDNIYRFGRYYIAQARLRPEVYTLSADVEHIVCTRGDRVRVAHDVPLWGITSGRVKAVAGQVVTLDEPVVMVDGKNYTLRFRLSDGSSLLKTAVTVAGSQTVITLVDLDMPAAGDLFMAGESNEESVVLRVRSITPDKDLSAKITFVDDAPEILDADSGTIPDFNSHVTAPPALFAAKPSNLKVRENFSGTGENVITGAFFSWETTAGQDPQSFETQFNDEDGDGIWKPTGSVAMPTKEIFVTDYRGGSWGFRVRAIYPNGIASDWATLASQPLTGGTVVATVPDGSLGRDKFAADVRSALNYFGQALLDLLENMDAISAAQQDQDLANSDDKKQVLAALSSQIGSTLATVQSVAATLATQNSATAAIATGAQATANNATASALWKMEATSTPAGTDTRVGTYLRTDTGSGYVAEAFEYLDIQADGSTRKVVNVDLHEILARDGSAAEIFDTRTGNWSVGSTS